MKHKRLQLIAIFLLGLGLTGIRAQESLNASGGMASGGSGSVYYSVGQIFYNANNGANGSISNGIQQPFEISDVIGIEEAKSIKLAVSAYPNPATDNLTLSINEFDLSNLLYQLYDMQGTLLQNEQITGKETSIAMSNLLPATYFVKIIKDNKEVKTFKIIKN